MTSLDATTGVHPTRKGHGREEITEPAMPVDAQLGLTMPRKKVEPMPQRREHIACRWYGVVAVEGRREPCDRPSGDRIVFGHSSSDPGRPIQGQPPNRGSTTESSRAALTPWP